MLAGVIEGVLSQERVEHPYEVIVVDDSPDGTLQLDRSGLRVLRSQGGGLNAARNLSIASSTAELFCFLDDDVEVPRDWLASMESAWGSRSEPICLGGRISLRLEGPAPRICKRCASRPLATTLDLEAGAEPRWAWGANFAVNRKAVELTGRFDEALRVGGDEVEWQHRFREAGGNITYVHEARVWHRRLPEDLKLRSLLRSNLTRGRNNAIAQARMGTLRHNPWRAMIGSVGHAIFRGCWGGLLRAANLVGHQLGRIEGRRSVQ